MKNSLRKKYIFAGCILIVGFLLFVLGISGLLKKSLVEYWNSKKMDAVASEVIQKLGDSDWALEREDMDDLAFNNTIDITVTDEELHIVSATRNWEISRGTLGEKTMKTLRDKKEELNKSGKVFFSSFDDKNKASFLQINYIKGDGYVIIRKSITGLNSSMMVMEICYVIAAVVTLLCGIPIIIYLSGKMVQPIREINQVTTQIAKLNFENSVDVKSSDELGMLAESVNTMSDRLKEALESLKKDVELRKALVRNMAHELKTPTAVIMGYAENMPYISREHPEKLEKYCQVISDECERMDSLIRQMLEFSSYENSAETVQKTEFSVRTLLDSIWKSCENEFPKRTGLNEEQNEISGTIRADYEMLHRALYNYVKNAVRYGKKNGRIRIRAWETEERVYFSVFNEGNPIPQEEQEKLWNVFYKGNPARTRDEDSFGIGLSIVKQAALAHEGGVGVRNVDGGVEFSLFIKNKK
ncbi:MAG: HAMP domain-containing sensor histidine kinase [Eubacteriales bacterium]|nr:HAMP domain-containing sensor histidine kinase [Eubacteriales bacterium]